jgi:hypothetical protein
VDRAIASSLLFAFTTANPSISSLLSANGPSVTVTLPPSFLIWMPREGRTSPPVSTTVPDASIFWV